MSEASTETLEAPAANGGREASIGGESKATVLARDDTVAGRLQIKGSGQILGNFSGQVDCDGDLFIGPEAHVEADIKSARITISGFVRGNVVAVSRLKIATTGRLEGDARVGALVVLEGDQQGAAASVARAECSAVCVIVSGDTLSTAAVSSTLKPPKKRNSTTRDFRGSIVSSTFSASSRAII